ncbi:ribosome modulation factor [Oleiphilus sp. HI0071]|jgi:ribosome modulation factor|uniref:ribosome modulation factor n=1 Tax=unclassified Oleiphilus TaxID=2631174 RepID=UPI0007C36890|nr:MULTISPECIES: ribosome modulation factor [unclassified Oleiphilus]KZY72166.1 ribosome modulation factor [Oleiphilus sp. HI0065]KZY86790.1 ribosome modulation factor [Oleiphilus sp. HI0071]KZY91687.1 ribosome modulation factor [Oleiphilus sp. HI0073]KZZ54679.1 ribosome modulation factor [Oleiphilus sp. HI0118]KZZ59754.1 ribosome modulation factor [Oleiphilus sp. HI0122]KZZ64278.1 ribosome modulation factor [Oleiphilus sp. HI0130]KZZ75023.1 ribosome modulation factor [Oleiphilus sp. HI0133]
MKRQKRNPMHRAYNRGYLAGISGKSKSLCAAYSEDAQQDWLNGWRNGREDNWDGLTGVSGIHRLPTI